MKNWYVASVLLSYMAASSGRPVVGGNSFGFEGTAYATSEQKERLYRRAQLDSVIVVRTKV